MNAQLFSANSRGRFSAAIFILSLAVGCGTALGPDAALGEFIAANAADGQAVVSLVNDQTVTLETFDDTIGLDSRAARGLVNGRPFVDFAAVDAVPYVGRSAFQKLLAYAQANGYGGVPVSVSQEELAAVALVNDPATTFESLDDDVGLDARAARNLMDRRPFATLQEIDEVPYVGPAALARLINYALDHGYGAVDGEIEVIFSPQLYAASHTARVETLIASATRSLDVAMYSFRDQNLLDALAEAVQRGVAVRILFEGANKERRLEGDAFERSTSTKLERLGANVRYVNKIMHHKLVIADGPKHIIDHALEASIATGSANWSYSAATRYDENTLFFAGEAALTLQLQREFDHLWTHSRDFVYDDTLPFELGTAEIDDETIEAARVPGAVAEAHFTSDNFRVRGDTTFSIVRGRNTISDQMVAAISAATSSIYIASGHLRSRPIAEALMEKRASSPDVDIKIYLDGQEYISAWYHNEQLDELEACLLEAGDSAAQRQDCTDRGFYFGYVLGDEHDIEVRYKHYAYRWHYSYAVQMHHKYMIVDGDELWTGSYNLSDNAEHNTFENMIHVEGASHQAVIDAFTENFLALFETSRADDTFAALLDEVATSDVIPLVYTPMSLTHDEVTQLKSAIRDNCAQINSETFRREPEKNRVCIR